MSSAAGSAPLSLPRLRKLSQYTHNQLIKRNQIIKTHILFGNFLDKYIINRLINIFDEHYKDNILNDYTIVSLIEKERKLHGLDDSNVTIKSEIYGTNVLNSTLFIKILKNNIEFLHLSIHLCVKALEPHKTGVVHISKDIFLNAEKHKLSRTKLKQFQKKLYALISIEQHKDKPNSLVFSIADGITTNLPNGPKYDAEIQKEMDVIISVLNKIFDEDNELYIGKKQELVPIHNKSNAVLNNINKHVNYVTRKNKGTKLLPQCNNSNIIKCNSVNKRNKKYNISKTRKRFYKR